MKDTHFLKDGFMRVHLLLSLSAVMLLTACNAGGTSPYPIGVTSPAPTEAPTIVPTAIPSVAPTIAPSASPIPTASHTASPIPHLR